jgi:integrase-like protein
LGIGLVNWQVLRRSYATWLVQAGADPKAVQGLMRHSRIGTTMDIYAQFVPESQRRAVVRMMDMVTETADEGGGSQKYHDQLTINWNEMERDCV